MIIPGMTIASTLAIGIMKAVIKRIADPEKILDILVGWLAEIAEADEKIDWKDKLVKLLKKRNLI
jgi:hypothetical protein